LKIIGLFGGTFDPVHNGHVSITESFINSGFIDELWVLLTPNPPHKAGNKHADYNVRLTMLKAAFEGTGVQILTIENELPRPSYSYQTIQYFKKQFPDHTFYYCIGEDSLVNFKTWKHYEKILDEADLLVARRPSVEHEAVDKEILKHATFVNHEPILISSSEIRELVADGKEIDKLVPAQVRELIIKNHLYNNHGE